MVLSSISLISALYYFFLSANFGLIFYSFSSSLNYKVRLFIWEIYFFLMYVFISMKLPLRSTYALSHKFQYFIFPFLFVSDFFYIPFNFLFLWLFSTLLFNFNISVIFPVNVLLLICTFLPL